MQRLTERERESKRKGERERGREKEKGREGERKRQGERELERLYVWQRSGRDVGNCQSRMWNSFCTVHHVTF